VITIIVSVVEPPTIGNPSQTLKKVVALGDRGADCNALFLLTSWWSQCTDISAKGDSCQNFGLLLSDTWTGTFWELPHGLWLTSWSLDYHVVLLQSIVLPKYTRTDDGVLEGKALRKVSSLLSKRFTRGCDKMLSEESFLHFRSAPRHSYRAVSAT
jgi:hypothetical protein